MTAADDELYSLLVPLSDERLIVPRACVAEVIRYTPPAAKQFSLEWILGSIGWNGRDLPVVAYEGAIGKSVPQPTGRTRVVVFHAGAGALRSGYYGMLTQGFPQLVRVNREVLRFESAEGWPSSAPVLCRVKMINEYPLIPDLEALERQIAADAGRPA